MEPIVKRNTNRDTEREHLNKILKWVAGRLDYLEATFGDNDQQPTNPGDGETFSLTVDEGNFAFTNVEGNSYYLDLAAEGIGTNELADLSVTYDKIDFTTFDSDDIPEGSVNQYFSDEKAQDAVGSMVNSGFYVDLIYDDLVPEITAELSASGTGSYHNVLRGDNQWADNVFAKWEAGSYAVTAFEYFSYPAPTAVGDIPSFSSGRHVGVITFTSSAGCSVQGVDNPYFGRLVSITSLDEDLLIENDSGIVASNGIVTPDGADYLLVAGNTLTLIYSGTRWTFYSTTGSSSGGGGSGVVETIVAGTGITVDSTDPANPIVSATATSTNYVDLTTGEALVAGNFVHINSSGLLFKANADDLVQRAADGFVKSSYGSGVVARMYLAPEINTLLSGLSVGTTYVLSDIAGGVKTAALAPAAIGDLYQELGVAISGTSLVTFNRMAFTRGN